MNYIDFITINTMIVTGEKIRLGMNNSYSILTGKCELEDIIYNTIDGEVWLAHDTSKSLGEVDFDLIIEYFAGKEEFEKCIELRKIEIGNSFKTKQR